MLTVIEKVLFLQNVDVFSEVATDKLAALATIAREIDEADAVTLYEVSDVSDCMYLVLEGEVRLHRDGSEVARAKSQEAFGTWALFDDELRVVSATTDGAVRLLRIDKEEFVDILADNVAITQGVLKALASRLRGMLSRVGVASGQPEGNVPP